MTAEEHGEVERRYDADPERLPRRPARRERPALARHPTAGALLTACLADHLVRLEGEDLLLRSGDQEGVHQLRVAARRLRAALATYAPILEPEAATRLCAELRWFGGVLSPARDAQVMRRRLSALVEQQPSELVLGPVADRVEAELGERFRTGHAAAAAALRGERYVRLLDALEAFLDAPPFTGAADADAREVVPGLVQTVLDRLRERDRAYRRATSPHERDLALHEVRKAAKRLRYAAETVRPVFGRNATRLAAQAEALQELLGEHQDSVVARATLREIGARAYAAGENGFTFGLLHALEAARAGDLERGYAPLLADLPSEELEAWLRT